MNITPVTSNYQTSRSQMKNTSQVNFRGPIGTKMLEKAGGLELKSVLSQITGFFGLEAGKVKDVLESFIQRINIQEKAAMILKQEIKSKGDRIATLEVQNKKMEQEAEVLKASITGRDNKIAELQKTVVDKDKQIAELEGYRKMADVKPISELGILMPKEVIAAINEAKENDVKAIQSAFEFAMTGKGQEELVKQIDRNNIVYNAIKDGMKRIFEVENSLEECSKNGLPLGFNQEEFARIYFTKALEANAEGAYLESTSIFSQVLTNIDAFLTPLRDPKYSYKPSSDVLGKALKYHRNIETNKGDLQRRSNMTLVEYVKSETMKPTESYYIFEKPDGRRFKITAQNLANGSYGLGEFIQSN